MLRRLQQLINTSTVANQPPAQTLGWGTAQQSTNSHPAFKPAYSRSGLQDLLDCVSTHYVQRVEHLGGQNWRNTYSQQLSDLGECACWHHTFDRSQNTRRSDAANRFVQTTVQQFPITASHPQTLTYFSMGSGALMQDFIICAMLLLQGYSLMVRLVEPICNRERFKDAYAQFICLQKFAAAMGLNFSAEYFPNVFDYMQLHWNERINVGHAIDFDVFHFDKNAKGDVLLAHQMLSSNGFFYVAAGRDDFLFQHTSALVYGPSNQHIAREFLTDAKHITEHENAVSQAISIRKSHITKDILAYVGLFQLRPQNLSPVTGYRPATTTASPSTTPHL